MGKKWNKFILFMWMYAKLEFRFRRLFSIIAQILVSLLFLIIPVILKNKLNVEEFDDIAFPPHCTVPVMTKIVDILCDRHSVDEFSLVYSPASEGLGNAMNGFRSLFKEVIQIKDSKVLDRYLKTNDTTDVLAVIQFDDNYENLKDLSTIKRFKVSIRFPGETRITHDILNENRWYTDLVYPVIQWAGPRQSDLSSGGGPSYHKEGFLGIQHLLTLFLIVAKQKNGKVEEIQPWPLKDPPPLINIRRFAHSSWIEEYSLPIFQFLLPIIIFAVYLIPCTCVIRGIVIEKEKQFKGSMKIIGLWNWLHWTAWFVRSFLVLILLTTLTVILLTTQFSKQSGAVLPASEGKCLFLFLIAYSCSTITFSFALSTLFSNANVAVFIGDILFFLTAFPYFMIYPKYNTFSLTSKVTLCLMPNTAMIFGIHNIIVFEGTQEGIRWGKLFKSSSQDNSLTLGIIIVMLIIDTIIYLLIALYVDAVYPGEFGIPKPWNFCFKSSCWRKSTTTDEAEPAAADSVDITDDLKEEPRNLRVGIEIMRLKKVFGYKVAVNKLTLNIYEGQITALLGNNGAGKTTTISMLVGIIPPTKGTAKINGFDIGTNIEIVRRSVGYCPQHNIVFHELTVAEHLYFFCRLKGLEKNKVNAEVDSYIRSLDLESKRKIKASKLSSGLKRKLCVGIALCADSKIVLLDEPTKGMDPSARRALWDLLLDQKRGGAIDKIVYKVPSNTNLKDLFTPGRTILLTTHTMEEADALGDRIAIMVNGRLKCYGSSSFLKKKYGVGYNIVFEKMRNCDPEKITQLLKTYEPRIEMYSNIGSKLRYHLMEEDCSQFEPMLKQLELNLNKLEALDYGISLTTLEEVFLKLDEGRVDDINFSSSSKWDGRIPKDAYTEGGNNAIGASVLGYSGRLKLAAYQFRAMFMKKFLVTYRFWITFLLHLLIPIILVILCFADPSVNIDLPPMPLDLRHFENPITLIEFSNIYDKYLEVLNDYNYKFEFTTEITNTMFALSNFSASTVRMRYIVGAYFDEKHITAYFNNDPYHSPAISLGLVLNAIFKEMLACADCSIEFTNHPMPFAPETVIKESTSIISMGMTLGLYLGLIGMWYIAFYFILFLFEESTTKFRHLQLVSGTNIMVYWLSSFIWDLLVYLMFTVPVIVTMACFQRDGFSSFTDLGRIFVILLCFFWAVIPMIYLDVSSASYIVVLMLMIVSAFIILVVRYCLFSMLDYTNTVLWLHWVLLILPQYSLVTSFIQSYKFHVNKKICSQCISGICHGPSDVYRDICGGIEESYFRFKYPGIGGNLIFSLAEGAMVFLVFICYEFKLFSRISCFSRSFSRTEDVQDEKEDASVAKEKHIIRNTREFYMLKDFSLVIRNLTKYYRKVLAVNSLCLAVRDCECFGLLGASGAGKTTVLKMLTGDTKLSYGDAWVKGLSIKTQSRLVYKCIGYCPQSDALPDHMTVNETIIMFGQIRGIELKECNELASTLVKEFDFVEDQSKKVQELSGGTRRKLSIVISLIGDPYVIFLDEPTSGLDPGSKRIVWNAICRMCGKGRCVIFASQNMEECEALCTRLAIMVNGEFKCLGSVQHIKTKFANPYTLNIKMQKSKDTGSVEGFVRRKIPEAKLVELNHELLTYHIATLSAPLSQMFGVMESAKRGNLNIEDYSLAQSSLEQVFLAFTKKQLSLENEFTK